MKHLKTTALSFFLASLGFAKSNETSFAFSCTIANDSMTLYRFAYVEPTKPKISVDLDYGISVELNQFDLNRLLISIFHDRKIVSSPIVMKVPDTTQLAIYSSGAYLNCRSQKKN